MKRRRVLTLVSTAAFPIAGCLGSGESSDTPTATAEQSETPTPTPSSDRTLTVGETYEASDGHTVVVHDVRVTKLIRSTSVGSSTHIDVACLDDHQFAVAKAEATDADGNSILSDIRFALEVDGVQYPQDDQHWYWAFPPGATDPPGLPAFPAPIADATDVAIVWLRDADPSVRWTLPPERFESLGQAPTFTVRSFDTPDSVRRGEVFEATFTVANSGERDGRFITEFGAGPLSDHGEVVVDVSAGAEQTHTGTMDPDYSEDTDEIDVTLDWGCDRLHRTVSVTD